LPFLWHSTNHESHSGCRRPNRRSQGAAPSLGLKPGQPLEIRAGDGRLEIEIAPMPMRLKKRGTGLVAVPDTELPALTAEQVRDALERVRR